MTVQYAIRQAYLTGRTVRYVNRAGIVVTVTPGGRITTSATHERV